ncbi:alpha/beta fold hydrolase [Agrobacterium sp. DSM 25558]|uniref:alpha/beta fold hydrolase n=1 Tax=Agrobacterium sp. DSM 25558 TaxID=1907665 RepID=UPI001FCE1BFF|nr:alpha/beta hydrolase [Agrobacterium sp. DSM 25558]
MPFSRRTLLAGLTALALGFTTPAWAEAPPMPPSSIVSTNGIKLKVYEAGSGPAVVLLHGFPGLAYTWRHQIPALVAAGYRVIVPDLRGYGASDAPADVEAYDITSLTGDLVGLLDHLKVREAVFMGHDWGGLLAWQMALLHRERVAGVVSLNTPHVPHWGLWLHPDIVRPALAKGETFVADPKVDPIDQMRKVYSRDMYVLMFQDGDKADEAMNAAPRATIRSAYRKDLMRSSEWGKLPEFVVNMEYYGKPIPAELPGKDVLNADELDVYEHNFSRTGFTPAINWYRNISRAWKAGLGVDQNVRVPALMITAEHDVVLRPSMTEGMRDHVPDLETHVIPEAWHWTPEEKPDDVNRLAIDWLQRRYPAR